MRISKFKPIVKQVLVEEPGTRSDDFRLIYSVLRKLYSSTITMQEIAYNHVMYGIPSFESITRMRRSIQKDNPELKEPKAVKIRKIEEKKYNEEFKRK